MNKKTALMGIIIFILGISVCNMTSVSAAKSKFVVNTVNGKKTLVKYKGKDKIVEIPNGVKVIGDSAFKNNQYVRTVKFSDTVRTIEYGSFANCKKLKTITFNKDFKSIQGQPFINCRGIKKLRLNKNLKNISEFGLTGMPNLKKISVAKGNKHFRVYKGALFTKNLRKLYLYHEKNKLRTKFIIPKETRLVNACAFSDNKYLKKLIVKNSIIDGEDTFSNMKSLETIIFEKPYRLSVGLNDCKKLKFVKLAEGTEQIGEEQFSGCENLTVINFPKSLRYIGKNAFAGCSKIKKPVFTNNVEVDAEAFE